MLYFIIAFFAFIVGRFSKITIDSYTTGIVKDKYIDKDGFECNYVISIEYCTKTEGLKRKHINIVNEEIYDGISIGQKTTFLAYG